MWHRGLLKLPHAKPASLKHLLREVWYFCLRATNQCLLHKMEAMFQTSKKKMGKRETNMQEP
jgi:hypothetical protein